MKKALILLLTFFTLSGFAQRRMEKLDRGLVAVKVPGGVFLSWRVFGNDPSDISFNIYRGSTKVNQSPITGATNITDPAGTTGSTYSVRPIINGTERNIGETAGVWGSQVLTLNLNRPPGGTTPAGENYSYSPNDCSVGDLDGDGQYEIVLKWNPSNAKDNSQQGYTGNVYIDAYKLDGTFLWRIDLGRNIRAGAHYTQFLVADFDVDGKAEVMCKTAENTRDASGNYLSSGPAANDNDNADYRSSGGWAGFITSGPEYLTVFNGETGHEMQTVTFQVGRGNVYSWGKSSDGTNRVDRFNGTIAYLDGQHPSAVFNRGYYGKMTHSAWDWDGNNLSNRWIFNSDDPGKGGAYAQGNHSMMAADVDDDGFDEILMGACAIDHDGSFLWATGHGHGDANHVGDFVPNNPGLEIFNVSENTGSEPDHYMIDARTGRVMWGEGSGNDNGRGICADIDADHYGQEVWSARVGGTKDCYGNTMTNAKPGSMNFRVYWDGDLQDELLDKNFIEKWNGNGIYVLHELQGYSCNGTKATPNLSADILGDWREEVILHDGASRIYISTTTIPTDYKLYTLMHDPVYRNAISWQQSSYNQPPHLGFYLADFNNVPKPDIFVDNTDCNGDINGTAYYDNCSVCVGGNTGMQPCAGSMQGEDRCTADGESESSNSGFGGLGYLNFTNTLGASGTWTLFSESSQTATIGVRYANGAELARSMTVSVNGSVQTQISGATTGGWTSWDTENISLNLSEGVNTIVLTSNTDQGGPNIDLFILPDATIIPGSCEEDCNNVFGGLAYIDDCNECVGGNTGKEACTQDCEGNWGGLAYLDECGICINEANSMLPCTGTLEAEDACGVQGITLENLNDGYSGAGYVNTENITGAFASWIINSSTSQGATLTFKFANNGTSNRDGQLFVNGVNAGVLSMPVTGAWNTWELVSINVELNQGSNEILLEALTDGGLANIDLIHYSDGISSGMCVITNTDKKTDSKFLIYPNPTQGQITLSVPSDWRLINMMGTILERKEHSDKVDLSGYPEGIYYLIIDGLTYKVIRK